MIHDDIKKNDYSTKIDNFEVQIFSPISLFRFEKKADVDTFLIFFSSLQYKSCCEAHFAII